MLAAIILVGFIAAYFLYTKHQAQQKEIKDLKRDFNKILDLVEPIVNNENVPQEDAPRAEQKQSRAPPQEPPSAPPYGYRPKREEVPHGETTQSQPRGPGVPVDVPSATDGGVTLENLAQQNEYSSLF